MQNNQTQLNLSFNVAENAPLTQGNNNDAAPKGDNNVNGDYNNQSEQPPKTS